jgi:hypothetical protein
MQECSDSDFSNDEPRADMLLRTCMYTKQSVLLGQQLCPSRRTLLLASNQHYWNRSQVCAIQLLNPTRQHCAVLDMSQMDDDKLRAQILQKPMPRLLCYLAFDDAPHQAIAYCTKHHYHPLESMRYNDVKRTVQFRFGRCTQRCFRDSAFGVVVVEWDGQQVQQWGTLGERFRGAHTLTKRDARALARKQEEEPRASTRVLQQMAQIDRTLSPSALYAQEQARYHDRVFAASCNNYKLDNAMPHIPSPTTTTPVVIATQAVAQTVQTIPSSPSPPQWQTWFWRTMTYDQYIDQFMVTPSNDLSWVR